MRVGQGYDVHRLAAGDHLMLGGLRFEADFGIEAHSDGDVLLHALCDALLGAAGLGDIGEHFPDSDPAWAGADSAGLLEAVVARVAAQNLRVANADLTLIAERPRIGGRRQQMRARIAGLLGVSPGDVNVKATTSEGLGPVGRGEGIAAMAVVLLVEG